MLLFMVRNLPKNIEEIYQKPISVLLVRITQIGEVAYQQSLIVAAGQTMNIKILSKKEMPILARMTCAGGQVIIYAFTTSAI